MDTLVNSEDPDEMLHYAAFPHYAAFHLATFHLGLHCLLRQNQSSEKAILFCLEIITCDPLIYTMDNPDLTVSNFMEHSIGPKRVNLKLKKIMKICILQYVVHNVIILLFRVPTEIQKHNSMIFHDQQCNFHDYLMHGLQPPLLGASSPR